jgi:hypothetical protein
VGCTVRYINGAVGTANENKRKSDGTQIRTYSGGKKMSNAKQPLA